MIRFLEIQKRCENKGLKLDKGYKTIMGTVYKFFLQVEYNKVIPFKNLTLLVEFLNKHNINTNKLELTDPQCEILSDLLTDYILYYSKITNTYRLSSRERIGETKKPDTVVCRNLINKNILTFVSCDGYFDRYKINPRFKNDISDVVLERIAIKSTT